MSCAERVVVSLLSLSQCSGVFFRTHSAHYVHAGRAGVRLDGARCVNASGTPLLTVAPRRAPEACVREDGCARYATADGGVAEACASAPLALPAGTHEVVARAPLAFPTDVVGNWSEGDTLSHPVTVEGHVFEYALLHSGGVWYNTHSGAPTVAVLAAGERRNLTTRAPLALHGALARAPPPPPQPPLAPPHALPPRATGAVARWLMPIVAALASLCA